jgi:hypothetical protein
MKAPVIAAAARTANEPSYRRDRPRLLLLVREETPTDYRASFGSAEPPSPPADEPETVADWGRVHARLVELGAERAAGERELCRWLCAAERLGVHARAGHASLREYAARLIGLSGRQTEERLRVGRALAELPRLDRALGSGKLCFSAVRELSRVATAETEEEWIDWARGKPNRQIEVAVASRRSGARPRDRAEPSLVKHRLRFEVRAETMALFRDLQATVRRDLGGDPVDDDTLLYEIARRALGGPGEAGRSSYQVALTRCQECGQASIDAGGRSHPVDGTVAEMAACDSQELGAVGADGGGGGDSSPSPHGADHQAPEARAEPPHPEPSSPRMGAAGVAPAPRRRASQTIPPAIRRGVMRRDRQRCVVPGCAHHLFLDVHHVDPRSEGGSHDPDRLVTLCGSHHRRAHAGSLCINGSATGGFSFRHADGAPYGQPLRPAAIDRAQQAFAALRHLGFRPSRARALVEVVVRAGAPAELAAFVRAALEAS